MMYLSEGTGKLFKYFNVTFFKRGVDVSLSIGTSKGIKLTPEQAEILVPYAVKEEVED
jgi:hypothetical protein